MNDTPTSDQLENADDTTDVIEDAHVIDEPQPADDVDAPSDAPSGRSGGSALLLILGGVLAGGIGFAAATFLPSVLNTQQDTQFDALIQQQSDTRTALDALDQRLSAQFETDRADVLARTAQLEQRLDALQAGFTQTVNRMESLEQKALSEVIAPNLIAEYQAELAALTTTASQQLAEIQNVADAAKNEIAEAKAKAAALELSAAQAARDGVALSAANTIKSALISGGVYNAALQRFMENSDIAVPEIVTDHADTGVPTLANIQVDFPDLARNALAQARSNGDVANDGAGFSSFLKSQLNVRSLTPQEGDDADAVLSRAEAAVSNGDLDTALFEIEKLTDATQSVLADWTHTIQTRQNAIAAAEDLAQRVSQN